MCAFKSKLHATMEKKYGYYETDDFLSKHINVGIVASTHNFRKTKPHHTLLQLDGLFILSGTWISSKIYFALHETN